MRNGVLDHQYLGSQCWYNTASANAAPDRKTCATPAPGGAQAANLSSSTPASNPLKYVVREWQVNTLAARGQAEDCKSREVETGSVRFSTAADATLVANLAPNPGAQVTVTAAIASDGTRVAVRMCNTGPEPVRWEAAPLITLTQLP